MVEMKLNIGNFHPKQLEFMRAKTKHVGFGGARGGGKSHGLRGKAKIMCGKYPGIKGMIVRRTYPELLANHISIIVPECRGFATYNRSEKLMTWVNGSTLKFGYVDNDAQIDRFQGQEYDFIGIDEATNLKEEWIRKLGACLRSTTDYPRQMYYTMNPGGVSHDYLKRLFITKRYKDNEKPEEYTFIQSLPQDNITLMKAQPDYIDQLRSLPPKIREAWLYGSWDVYEGQVFEEFMNDPEHYEDRRWTHVIEPFDMAAPETRHWKVYRSFDWGYARPFSCSWTAIDHDGVAYRFMEMYGCGEEPNTGVRWEPDKVFSEIAKTEREHPWLKGRDIQGIADPAIWQKDTGTSIADMAARQKVYFTPGDNKRIPGWMQVHYRLRFDESGYPMFYVFKTCKDFIRTLPTLCYDPVKVEDVDSDGEDHQADELRYLFMAHPITPKAPKEEKPIIIDPLQSMDVQMQRYRRMF